MKNAFTESDLRDFEMVVINAETETEMMDEIDAHEVFDGENGIDCDDCDDCEFDDFQDFDEQYYDDSYEYPDFSEDLWGEF